MYTVFVSFIWLMLMLKLKLLEKEVHKSSDDQCTRTSPQVFVLSLLVDTIRCLHFTIGLRITCSSTIYITLLYEKFTVF